LRCVGRRVLHLPVAVNPQEVLRNGNCLAMMVLQGRPRTLELMLVWLVDRLTAFC
jgi:hypothetical protein